MARLLTIVALLAGFLLAGQDYAGPRPARKDMVYLVHADNLIATEVDIARMQASGDSITYVVPGDRSRARTPLASPTLIIESSGESSGIAAEKLRLFRLEVKNGHRELSFHYRSKAGAMPLRAEITKISGGLYKIDVLDSLCSGEYAFSPDGSNDVFCFEVF